VINRIKLLRNIGQYDSVIPGSDTAFGRLTLVYAENGRGKTTLCAIFRSLATGDALPITERRRLGSEHLAHVVLECADSPSPATFENGAWTRLVPNVAVFDDAFVDENVYSGLTVGIDHRQNLHELILGARGVTLGKDLQTLVDEIEGHNRTLRSKGAAIPAEQRGNLSVEDFCAMSARPNLDEELLAAERKLAAACESEPIRAQGVFEPLSLPMFDVQALENLLARDLSDLDASAAVQVQEHLSLRAGGAESWVAQGMQLLAKGKRDACPFCAQDIGSSQVIRHYQAYFSEEYRALKQDVAQALVSFERTHSGDVPAAFERAIRIAGERRHFWSRFCDLPDVVIDTVAVSREWRAARESIVEILKAKQGAPLDRKAFPVELRAATDAYELHRRRLAEFSTTLQQSNSKILLVKEQAASGDVASLSADVAKLKSCKARYSPATVALCEEYLLTKAEKSKAEKKRDAAKAALDQYRVAAFPGFQGAINVYLANFNAGFRLDHVAATNTRGGPTCTYNVLINNIPVPVAAGEPAAGQPSFKNTLSAGDRNTLALAFFFASLDQDPNLATKVVVIDDPVSSLDDHRSLTTVQEMRRLAARTAQLVVLSHTKGFLCRVWGGADKTERSAIRIVRQGSGSTIAKWDVEQDSITEHDRRHALLMAYAHSGGGSARDVAQSIRPLLEGYLRAACPQYFPPGTLLGPFLGKCAQQLTAGDPILESTQAEELRNLVEYANRFHHDTNAAWETEVINAGELDGFVERTLKFASL